MWSDRVHSACGSFAQQKRAIVLKCPTFTIEADVEHLSDVRWPPFLARGIWVQKHFYHKIVVLNVVRVMYHLSKSWYGTGDGVLFRRSRHLGNVHTTTMWYECVAMDIRKCLIDRVLHWSSSLVRRHLFSTTKGKHTTDLIFLFSFCKYKHFFWCCFNINFWKTENGELEWIVFRCELPLPIKDDRRMRPVYSVVITPTGCVVSAIECQSEYFTPTTGPYMATDAWNHPHASIIPVQWSIWR